MPTLIHTVQNGLPSHESRPRHRIHKKFKLTALSSISLITTKMIGTSPFSTPSIIFKYCNGDVGLFLSTWVLGALIVFSGLVIYIEFALNLPLKNGGEKNYLLRVFRRPKGLWGCMYAFQMAFLGFSSANSFAFGEYMWFAISGEEEVNDGWASKMIGAFCITFCVWLHIKYPKQGASFFNFLGMIKILLMFLIVAIGFLVYVNVIEIPPQPYSLVPSTKSSNRYYTMSVALLENVYSFKGWENANYVLLDVPDPYRVLTVAAPFAVSLVTILYFLIAVSYILVLPKAEFMNSGVLVAGIFFNKIFGESITSRVLPVLISLLTLGDVMEMSFGHSQINQDLARNNFLPFSKYFEDINHSLILHWVISVLILVAPPTSATYEFVINLDIYPGTWINLFICLGLIYLKLNAEEEKWGRFNVIKDIEGFVHENSSLPHFRRQANRPQSPLLPSMSQSPLLPSMPRSPLLQSMTSAGSDQSSGPGLPFPTYTEFDLLITDTQLASKSNHKPYSAPWICLVLFLVANVYLALFPFFPPARSNEPGAVPFWCFPVLGTGCLLLGAVFFYLRRWYYKHEDMAPPAYEDDYNSHLLR